MRPRTIEDQDEQLDESVEVTPPTFLEDRLRIRDRFVLVVDNDPETHLALQMFLQVALEGVRVISASSPHEALAALRDRPVDLVVIGEHVRSTKGTPFIDLCHDRYPRVPRVAVGQQPSTRANATLPPPVDGRMAVSKIHELLGGHPEERTKALERAEAFQSEFAG
ncbi:MAG: hypothetical protein R3185_01000 [Candidatus Thermoplasmatota archaeon]|nr:hypothetical protein [Candidatus Thermoplasmatota archaeon]